MNEKCLLVQYSMDRSGSTVSGLQICEALLKLGYSVTVVYSSEGPLRTEYEKLGAKTLCYRAPHWLLPGPLWRRFFLLPRLLMSALPFTALIVRDKYSLIYGNNILAAYAIFAAIIGKRKAIWHIREAIEENHSQLKYPPFGKIFIGFLIKRVVKVVFVSSALKAEFSSIHDYNNFEILYNSLPDLFFSMQRGTAISREQDQVVIGVPGTIRPEKGLEFLLETIIKNSKNINGIHFIISGTLVSKYAREIKKKIESSSIAGQVEFIGEVDDMREFYDACDLICVPSPYETFGRTIVEAGARNRAVICCSKGGAQEIIGKSDRGLYIDYGDDTALIEALMLLAKNTELRDFFANELRSWVLQNTSFDGFFQKFQQIAISSKSRERDIDN